MENLARVKEGIEAGHVVALDLRREGAYLSAHVPSAVLAAYAPGPDWVRAVKQFPPLSRRGVSAFLIAPDADILKTAEADLRAEGIAVESGLVGVEAWEAAGLPVARVRELSVEDLAKERAEWTIVDVREPHEWVQTGVIEGAELVPLGQVAQAAGQKLPPGKRYAVVCAHGNRSKAAATWLADRGFEAATVVGGMARWANRFPTVAPS